MKVFEKVDSYDDFKVEVYRGVVGITVESDWQDIMLGTLLSYSEWDNLVAAVARVRGEQQSEKFNSNGTGY